MLRLLPVPIPSLIETVVESLVWRVCCEVAAPRHVWCAQRWEVPHARIQLAQVAQLETIVLDV